MPISRNSSISLGTLPTPWIFQELWRLSHSKGISSASHSGERTRKSHRFNGREFLSPLQTHVDAHIGMLNSSASLMSLVSWQYFLGSQGLNGRKFISQMFPYITLSISSSSEIIPTIFDLSPESKTRLYQCARDEGAPSLGSQNVTVQK